MTGASAQASSAVRQWTCAVAITLSASPCAALDDWQISGDLTLRSEFYRDGGTRASSRFPDRGLFGYGESNLAFSRRYSEFERVDGQLSGVLADNPYRIQPGGFTLERANLRWQKGDTWMPFRAEAGDLFVFTTARTLQRSLKGLQLEVQPDLGRGMRHSMVGFAGASGPDWRDFQPRDEQVLGGSWLTDFNGAGSVIASLVVNRFASGSNGGLAQRSQQIASIAAETSAGGLGQSVDFSGEIGWFNGDDAGNTRPDAGGLALFAEARGRSDTLPLDYSLRFEDFDRDYAPNGSAATPGRRLYEARAGWRFEDGFALRGRAQYFISALGSRNEVDNTSGGVSAAGPLDRFGLAGVTGSADYGYIRALDALGTTDTLTHSFRLSGTTAIDRATQARAGYSWQSIASGSASTVMTHQLNASVDRRFDYRDADVLLGPNVTLRYIDSGASAGVEVSPGLRATATRGPWSLEGSYRFNLQARRAAGADADTHDFAVRLDYRQGQHSVSFEADAGFLGRERPGHNAPLRVGLSYTYAFDKPAGMPLFGTGAAPAPSAVARVTGAGADLAALTPNGPLTEALGVLEQAGLTGGRMVTDGRIQFDTIVYRRVDLPQRLVLEYSGTRLREAAVVIDVSNQADGRAVERDLQSVLQALIAAYGPPDDSFERGIFDGDAIADLRSGRLIRVFEWRTRAGVMRLGIPRRIDGEVRIEVHHARSFPPPNRTLWGLRD